MNVTLKNISYSQRQSDETNCFVATVYIDGKKAGTVQDDGKGGCMDYDFNTAALEAYAKTLPPLKGDADHEYPQDADLFIGGLFEKWLWAKEIKRLCKGKTTFELASDAKGLFRSLNRPYSPEQASYIRNKYGNDLVRILNEEL